MNGQPIFSEVVREDLIDCMQKSSSITSSRLQNIIKETPREIDDDKLSISQIMAMSRRDLVGEVVDLIEQNFDGKAFSADRERKYIFNLDDLKKEREVVEYKDKVQEYNGMMAFGISAGENSKPSETIEFLRTQAGIEDREEKLLPDPCKTPKGASISMSARGITISNASGEHLSNLKEGFENIDSQLPGLRADALKSAPSNDKKRDLESGMGLG